jgi:phosphotransferase system enzyme I (PtsI)
MELRGIGVSPGIAAGEAVVVEREAVPVFRLLLPADQVEAEGDRLRRALEESRGQLARIRDTLAREYGGAHAIFDAHLLMLEDPLLVDRALAVIREQRVNAEWSLRVVADQLHAVFAELSDPYLRERRRDLDDVLGRVQINLAGGAGAPSLGRLPGAVVLVATDLTPSDAAELDWKKVLGVALERGSSSHHTAILARSLGVPAVVGVRDATAAVRPGTTVLVDGTRGRLVVEPGAPALAGVRETQERDREEERRLQETRALPAVTADGHRVTLRANVEFPEEATAAPAHGAEGIGLFRSEYLLGRARQWPDEERQLEAYLSLLEQVHPHPVTVRTWDVGPEDLVPAGPTSVNPALGERALRLARRAPQAFLGQLRALWRAGARGPLRAMFPFVSGPADVAEGLDLVAQAREAAVKAGHPVAEQLLVGVNVEVPGAALTLDLLPREVAFASLGTNDLVQYLLAADRSDPRLAPHYQPLHPAVLRVIHGVVEAARARALPLAVCGEMAGQPLLALLLLGLGIEELSMRPAAVPRVKAALRASRMDMLREVAAACLRQARAEDVHALLCAELRAATEAAGAEAALSS